ncbi:MAG: WG repeat-containing protein [Moheibacter sp.]
MKTKRLFAICFFLFGTMILQAQELKPFEDENGKYGYKNNEGDVVIIPKYDHAEDFSEGLAVVGLNFKTSSGWYDTKYGYINESGEEVIQIIYVYASDFKNGTASVQLIRPTLTESEANSEHRGSIIAEKIDELTYYIDKTGKRVN